MRFWTAALLLACSTGASAQDAAGAADATEPQWRPAAARVRGSMARAHAGLTWVVSARALSHDDRWGVELRLTVTNVTPAPLPLPDVAIQLSGWRGRLVDGRLETDGGFGEGSLGPRCDDRVLRPGASLEVVRSWPPRGPGVGANEGIRFHIVGVGACTGERRGVKLGHVTLLVPTTTSGRAAPRVWLHGSVRE